jgi:hypothetical protein
MAYKVTCVWVEQVDPNSATKERKVIIRLDAMVMVYTIEARTVPAG